MHKVSFFLLVPYSEINKWSIIGKEDSFFIFVCKEIIMHIENLVISKIRLTEPSDLEFLHIDINKLVG